MRSTFGDYFRDGLDNAIRIFMTATIMLVIGGPVYFGLRALYVAIP